MKEKSLEFQEESAKDRKKQDKMLPWSQQGWELIISNTSSQSQVITLWQALLHVFGITSFNHYNNPLS